MENTKNTDLKEFIILTVVMLFLLYQAPEIIKTLFNIGVEVGSALTKWF